MRFRILRVEELPLGTRVLRPGERGADVKELQELLTQNGFYFGKIDGKYGLLTEEAVRLLERTFRLTVDGIAGPKVINTLKDPNCRTGRIIYTVKRGENLNAISQRFNVNPNAWMGFPGRGNPGKRLYPGMRLLLHEKAVLLWDDPTTRTASHLKEGLSKPERQLRNNIKITHQIQPGWVIDENGDLACRDGEIVSGNNSFKLIEASSQVWQALFSSKTLRTKLESRLRKLRSFRLGLDFRTAPLHTIIHWPKFIKLLSNNIKPLWFVILPLLPLPAHPREKHPFSREAPVYWLSLPLIAKFAGLLIFEPLLNMENPSTYLSSAAGIPRALIQLGNCQINHKSLLVLAPECREWNMETLSNQKIPYAKAKMIRAVNFRAANYCEDAKLTSIQYTSRRQSHCLVYREIQGFEQLFALVNKANLLGLVIRDFESLGKAGINIILDSCATMPEEKLHPRQKSQV